VVTQSKCVPSPDGVNVSVPPSWLEAGNKRTMR
jgi:hypothetical protein